MVVLVNMTPEKIVMSTIIREFLESSSSSSDEEKDPIPKIKNYIENVVHELSDRQFKRSFRIERITADHVIENFGNSSFYKKNKLHGGSPISSAETHILAFIWFASNKCCLRDVAERFGIGLSTLFRQNNRVMEYLVSIASAIIKFPKSEDQKEHMATSFQEISGFPHVLGCVDGTSILVRTPAHKIKSTYVNRHDAPAITLQGICDYKKRFTDIFTGMPGKIHDARVFDMSFIGNDIQQICGTQYHLLGDSAYNLREYLLTPYRDYGTLTASQINFNYKLSASRVLIENTFGLLKGRFRQVSYVDFHDVDKITKFIISCCVLHNLCIEFNDIIEVEELPLEDDIVHDNPGPRELLLRRLGEAKRNTLCNVFNTN